MSPSWSNSATNTPSTPPPAPSPCSTPDYTLTAKLTATTTIDWGDGETDPNITRPGATYDQVDGDLDHERLIRHVYTDAGPTTITATDTWTVTLTLQGIGTNTVTDITRTEATTIDIIELQAVVTNP